MLLIYLEELLLLKCSCLLIVYGMPGPVVRCESCDETRAPSLCKPVAPGCLELVREPGCGCCYTCALRAGAACGVYTERCGSGLQCLPEPGEARPLQALLEGRGVCSSAPLKLGPRATGNANDSEEDGNSSSTENLAIPNTHRLQDSKSHQTHHRIEIIKKGEQRHARLLKQVDYNSQSTDTIIFSSETKQELEFGPCRREMESILKSLKSENDLSPKGLYIPNCDKKGFYKKKQCRPSKGRKRGHCWCVDKYGQPLPGYDGKEKGEIHCYNLESK